MARHRATRLSLLTFVLVKRAVVLNRWRFFIKPDLKIRLKKLRHSLRIK